MDVQAATDVWLARLPAPERLAAQAATDAQAVGWIAGALVFVIAAALVARLGLLGALRRRIEADRPRRWLADAAAGASLATILALANAWAGGIAAWRVDAIRAAGGGLPPAEGLVAHLSSAMAGVPATIAAAVIIAPPLLWLMRRRRRSWPAIVGSAVLVLILAFGWLPYAVSAGASTALAPPSPARDAVARLADDAQAGPVRLSTDPSFDADVTGGFGHATVTLGPLMAAGPRAEASAYVGHLMGHYVHNDVLVVCLVVAAVVIAGLFAAQAFAAPLARALGDRRERTLAKLEVLPALAIIGAITVAGAGLAGAAYLRWANVRADAYSLDSAGEPDGLAAVIERKWDHEAVAPSPLETALFYSHPPLKDRIAHAMAWKTAHAGGIPVREP
ncbi:MAG TPA: M48 family metalloprotease [Caulobacteraceae bacterium]|nr:M48 family metalloprotease [Caulobacteraceae bacterium]